MLLMALLGKHEEAIRRKRDLLEIELQRYFGQTCIAIVPLIAGWSGGPVMARQTSGTPLLSNPVPIVRFDRQLKFHRRSAVGISSHS
jgi:hypothetical protein